MEAATAPTKTPAPTTYRVVDLFSGAGGMSTGFAAHPDYSLEGAADGEIGKPSTGFGHLECNATYRANLGVQPVALDLATVEPSELRARMALTSSEIEILVACAPCTGFSRARSANHSIDDPRNGLVGRTADFVREFKPRIVLMENARELITGRFNSHYRNLVTGLARAGYDVAGEVHTLTRFGLPQQRERALVIAVEEGLELRTIGDLWSGYQVRPEATTVRRAIGHLPSVAAGTEHPSDPMHVSTAFGEPQTLERLRAMPHDGGSWPDLYRNTETRHLLTPNMWRAVEKGRLNTHPDAYGRMAWDKPAPTIKRECSHVGNGRYAHPEQDRLCTVREMALLQGFPSGFTFSGGSRKNRYRQIGDAVPPLVAYQLAHLCSWILTGRRPEVDELLLPGTHLRSSDIVRSHEPMRLAGV